MSGTRHATDGTFHPCRYASAPEFERGLAFTLVAKVAGLLNGQPADRDLVWFLQYLSFQEGGLSRVAGELAQRYTDRFGTARMNAIGKHDSAQYTAEEMHKIRLSFPQEYRPDLELWEDKIKEAKGEIRSLQMRLADSEREVRGTSDAWDEGMRSYHVRNVRELPDEIRDLERDLEKTQQAAIERPDCFTADKLQAACIAAASDEGSRGDPLNKVLSRICLDPSWDWATDGGPWYFVRLIETLRDFKKQWESDSAGLVETPVVSQIRETLDYCAEAGGLFLLTGPGNVGAQYAARELSCRQPGGYRCFDVPPTNDSASFFRGIGQALGGNFTNYKNVQIEERVRGLLRSGDLTLVLTSAENLWPQKNLREAFPTRLAWLMSQTENGAKVCLISGPQFFMQKRPCEKSGWNSPEFAQRFAHIAALPTELSVENLAAIAQKVLPSARAADCTKIAVNAVASERYLVSVKFVAKRAQFIAGRAGRIEPNSEDVEAAIVFVGQSDKFLAAQLEQNSEAAGRRKHGPRPDASPALLRRALEPSLPPFPAQREKFQTLTGRRAMAPAPAPENAEAENV